MVPVTAEPDIADADLLDRLQRAAWSYFPANTSATTGLAFDNSRPNVPVSIAVVGFALACCPVAVQRGWIGRQCFFIGPNDFTKLRAPVADVIIANDPGPTEREEAGNRLADDGRA